MSNKKKIRKAAGLAIDTTKTTQPAKAVEAPPGAIVKGVAQPPGSFENVAMGKRKKLEGEIIEAQNTMRLRQQQADEARERVAFLQGKLAMLTETLMVKEYIAKGS